MSSTTTKRYTLGEEIFNSVSHGVGALLAVVGASVLVTIAACFSNARAVSACCVYGVSLVLLYTMSTLYHALPFEKAKSILRVFDHCTIFLLIAGSYTPFTLLLLQSTPKGMALFVALWVCAVIGVVVNCFGVDRFAKLSMVLYVVMGWAAIVAIGDIVRALPTTGLVLLVAGGLSYTGGLIFYKLKKRYAHSIWHLFVLAGSVLHYFCVIFYVLPLNF